MARAFCVACVPSGRRTLNNCDSGVNNDVTAWVALAAAVRMRFSAILSFATDAAALSADTPSVWTVPADFGSTEAFTVSIGLNSVPSLEKIEPNFDKSVVKTATSVRTATSDDRNIPTAIPTADAALPIT